MSIISLPQGYKEREENPLTRIIVVGADGIHQYLSDIGSRDGALESLDRYKNRHRSIYHIPKNPLAK